MPLSNRMRRHRFRPPPCQQDRPAPQTSLSTWPRALHGAGFGHQGAGRLRGGLGPRVSGHAEGLCVPTGLGQGTLANFLKCPTLCSQAFSLGATLGDSVLGPAPWWHSPLQPGPALGLGCPVLTLKLIAIHPISPRWVLEAQRLSREGVTIWG